MKRSILLCASLGGLFIASEAAAQAGVLARDGITLAGSSRPLTFGESQADVLARAASSLGGPPTQAREAGCRNGDFDQASWTTGLTLVFKEGRFVGWLADRRLPADYVSRAGIGFGRTVADMKRGNAGLILSDTPQGRQFGFDGMWGEVRQPGDAASLDSLRSGETCSRR